MMTAVVTDPADYSATRQDRVRRLKPTVLRSAAASFASHLNVRSDRWESILTSRLEAMREFEESRRSLLEWLFEEIGRCEPKIRSSLIGIRRDIFNGRRLTPSTYRTAPSTYVERFNRHTCLEQAIDLRPEEIQDVVGDFRLKMRALLDDQLFVAALDYSCPWLAQRLLKSHTTKTSEFTNVERGVYSYAVKMFSKANPFHLFAGVSLAGTNASEFSDFVEIVIDTGVFESFERLLSRSPDHERTCYLSLCPTIQTSERVRFLVAQGAMLQMLSLPNTPLLASLIKYCQSPENDHTIEGAISYVEDCALVKQDERLSIRALIQQLCTRNILTPYWIKDSERLTDELPSMSKQFRELAQIVANAHRSILPVSEVPRIHAELTQLAKAVLPASNSANAYYLNLYLPEPAASDSASNEKIRATLQKLRPLFSVTNCAEETGRIRAWLISFLRTTPDRRCRYIDLIGRFLDQGGSLASPNPENGAVQKLRKGTLSAVQRAFSDYEDELDANQLVTLAERLCEIAPDSWYPSELCINGPRDSLKSMFFISNVFVGHRRYLSRFGELRDLPLMDCPDPEVDGIVDVQLTVSLSHSRDSAKPIWRVGTGFNSKDRHRFEEWINLADVVIELSEDDRIRYVDDTEGRIVRIHFDGYLVTSYLPPAFKLLLLDHADFCYVPSGPAPYAGLVRHVPFQAGLYLGNVCLRRPQWHLTRSTLKPVLAERQSLAATVRLCHLLEATTGTNARYWYYRATVPDGISSKPRLLCAHNPLSLICFRREVERLPDSGIVSLTEMRPNPDDLGAAEYPPQVTELYLEI